MSKLKSKLKFLLGYLMSKIKKPILDAGTIVVTRNCNKKCDYCFTKQNNKSKEELSLKEIKKVIDKYKEFGVWYLALYGGEPTLRKDLADIVKYANDKKMFTILHTNGSFINVAPNDLIKAGIDIIDIAIDSISNPGLKNYNEVKDTLKKLVKSDVGVKLNHCIFKDNYFEISKILKLSKDYNLPISIHLGECSPINSNGNYDSTLLFQRGMQKDINEVGKISKLLIEESKKNKLIINPVEYFKAWSGFMNKEKSKWECKAGDSSLVVNYNGAMLQCVSATSPIKFNGKTLYYGDINKDNISIVKQKIQKSKSRCKSKCISCAYMAEDFSINKPLKILKIINSF